MKCGNLVGDTCIIMLKGVLVVSLLLKANMCATQKITDLIPIQLARVLKHQRGVKVRSRVVDLLHAELYVGEICVAQAVAKPIQRLAVQIAV